MATHSLLALWQAWRTDPASLAPRCTVPVLIWEPPARAQGLIETTDVTGTAFAAETGEPVALEVVKGGTPNAFPFGVTIGHAENNDLVLRHGQVSRFHAYVQELGGRRHLVDASSKNGTFLDGERLQPSRPRPLPPQARLRFGRLEVVYLEPEQLGPWLTGRLGPGQG